MQSHRSQKDVRSRTGGAIMDAVIAMAVLSIAIVIVATGFRSVTVALRNQQQSHLARLEIDHAHEVIASWGDDQFEPSQLTAWLEEENRSIADRELKIVSTLESIREPITAFQVTISIYDARPTMEDRPPLAVKTIWVR